MSYSNKETNLQLLVKELNFKQKVDRSLSIIQEAYDTYGERLVVAHSLGKDSIVTWDLAKRINPNIKGFIVTTRFKPEETIEFMGQTVAKYPELKVFKNDEAISPKLYKTNPDACCDQLKVEPIRRAIKEMNAAAWVTGIRCTEGRTRTNFQEIEELDKGLKKINPVLLWHEREIWQYLAVNNIPVNPLYAQGYRSLGCKPCTRIVAGSDERDGRWVGTSKCGGECGIHTRPLIIK